MPEETTQVVSEKIQTIDRVSLATRIFLGGAFAFGVGASAMGFFFMNDLTGLEKTRQPVVINQPLRVMDIVRAISMLEPLGPDPFHRQLYYAGSTEVFDQTYIFQPADETIRPGQANDPLSIVLSPLDPNASSRAPLFGIPTAHAQVTSFSIEPIPFDGLPDQYIYLWYRLAGDTTDRNMTLCLGRTEAATVYVGSDGSTYTDRRLTHRTTTRSCDAIRRLNQGVRVVSQGSIATEPTNSGEYGLVRWPIILGRFTGPDFHDARQVNSLGGTYVARTDCCSGDDAGPLERQAERWGVQGGGNGLFGSAETLIPFIGFDNGNVEESIEYIQLDPIDQSGGYSFTSSLRLTASSTGVTNACGGAFVDEPWSNCWSSLLGNGPVTDATDEQYVAIQFVFDPGKGTFAGVKIVGNDGSTGGGAFHLDVAVHMAVPTPADLAMPIYGGFSPATDEQLHFDPTVPAAIISLADTNTIPGQTVYQYLCWPAGTFDETTSGPVVFFDKDGNPYSDIFLVNRLLIKDCPSMLANGLHLTDITNGVLTTNAAAWPSQAYLMRRVLNQNLASINPPGGYQDNNLTVPAYVRSPLHIGGEPHTSPTPQTIPVSKLVLTGVDANQTSRTVTLCVPPSVIPGLAASPAYFFNASGKPYSDIFLTQPVSCSLPGGTKPPQQQVGP